MADAQTKFLGIRLPLQLAEKMDEVLKAEGMQITEYVRGLVRENLRKRGLLSPSEGIDEPVTTEASRG